MKTSFSEVRRNRLSAAAQWWAAPAAFLCTLLALPVNAGIVVPDDPLTSSVRVAPNIAFILDNSGSMALVSMPTVTENFDVQDPNYTGTSTGASSTGLKDNPHDRSYLNNGVYYNPNVTYQPWMKADGTRMSGGQDPSKVFLDWNLADTSRGTRDLRDNLESIFYVPKAGVTSSTNASDFVRYWIRNNSGTAQVVSGAPTQLLQITQTVPKAWWASCQTINVPAGTSSLEITIAGNTNSRGNADLYVRRSACPGSSSGSYDYQDTGSGSSQSVIITNPQSGTWYVNVLNTDSGSGNRDVTDNVLTANAYRTITPATPTGRTQADELTNIATWYSYYRTRIKTAKGGASEAFRNLGAKQRVGIRFINNGTAPNINLDIPVGSGDGRFLDASDGSYTNRTSWYNRLQSAKVADGSTPLRKALNNAGIYFQDKTNTGPYGPEATADQFSCRQNFTILTTDGYWNDSVSPVGNADGNSGSTITGPKGKSYTYSPAWPYSDTYSDTLADIAMYYWKNDLRSDLTNNVPDSSADPAFWQHMVTFSISIGLSGTRGWGSVEDVFAATSNKSWPQPAKDSPKNIDDLLHAAVNGHGQFVPASNPNDFTAGLTKALATIAQRTSSFSNVSTNAATIKTGGKVFNASYVSGLWTGTVKAWTLDANNEPTTQAWVASIPAVADRKVYTFNGATGDTFPTSTQLLALARSGGPTNFPVTGTENAAYIKGDTSKEERNGGLLRNRTTSVLGDIVNSSPAYVDDTQTLYVGANDGMLHAFDAGTGVEQFAYVPGLVNFTDLNLLSRGDYTHKWFVDGPVVVTTRKLTPGENYLVGSLGRGGKGMYGLDVSTPASFGKSSVKWELADTAKGNMGLVTGRPILTKVKTGDVAAIVGNGVNSTNNKAVLIVVNAKTGAVIREIDTGAGGPSSPNGLAAATGILGPDGKTIAYAYAGDRLGNVWKFDMTDASASNWTATKLFTAKSSDGTGAVQPITGAVTVATDPRTYKRWVFFGTGSYMTTTESDDKTAETQGMYGFVDDGSTVAYSDLVKRGVSNTGAIQDGYPVRTFDAKADLPSNKKGWYLTLPGNGERIVQDAQLVSNILITASMIPEGDACEASGTGYINALDAFTGTSAGSSFFDLNGDGKTTDTVIGGVPVGSVNFGVGMPTLPIFLDGKLVVGGTNAGEKPGSGGISGKSWSRVSWREIRSD